MASGVMKRNTKNLLKLREEKPTVDNAGCAILTQTKILPMQTEEKSHGKRAEF